MNCLCSCWEYAPVLIMIEPALMEAILFVASNGIPKMVHILSIAGPSGESKRDPYENENSTSEFCKDIHVDD